MRFIYFDGPSDELDKVIKIAEDVVKAVTVFMAPWPPLDRSKEGPSSPIVEGFHVEESSG